MKATLTIELEVLVPISVTNSQDLQQLHPSDIKWIGIRLAPAPSQGEHETVTFRADNTRLAIRNLVEIIDKAQPKGTSVIVWFQGRCEKFYIDAKEPTTGGAIDPGRNW